MQKVTCAKCSFVVRGVMPNNPENWLCSHNKQFCFISGEYFSKACSLWNKNGCCTQYKKRVKISCSNTRLIPICKSLLGMRYK